MLINRTWAISNVLPDVSDVNLTLLLPDVVAICANALLVFAFVHSSNGVENVTDICTIK